MKTNTKLSIIAVSIMSALSFNAFAQDPAATTPVESVKKGNSFERETTPLLREFARKKSQLELRKIDRELEKIDEESLKAQLDADSKTSSSSSGAYDPFAGSAKGTGNVMAQSQMMTTMPVAEPVSDVKVLMIYGFDNKLLAKITSGQQGGYVVKAGDIMPDGRGVANITSNYIEVKKNTGEAKAGVERIFVSATVQSGNNQAAAPEAIPGGVGGSATVNKVSVATPQALANETAAASLLSPMKSPGVLAQ